MRRATGRNSSRAAVGLIALAGMVVGCGDDSGSARSSLQGVEGVQLEDPINLADCRSWNEGTVEERLGTIRQIREFTGGPVQGTGGTGVVLEDEEAYDLFENYCENEFARGFKLYKLYARAAAFSGENTPP